MDRIALIDWIRGAKAGEAGTGEARRRKRGRKEGRRVENGRGFGGDRVVGHRREESQPMTKLSKAT